MTISIRAAFLFLIFSIILFGCESRPSKTVSSDTVIAAISTEPHRLNPILVSDLISSSISKLIFKGLTKNAEDASIVGDLAQSWDIKDDGRELVFYLKKGIIWHDGKEFTSEDVVFTYRLAVSPDIPTPHSSNFGPVKEVIAVDSHIVRVLYSEPYGSALESWSIGIIPKHLLENKDINSNAFDRNPIGTGPYTLKEWVSGQFIRLEAFKQNNQDTPKIKKLILKIIPDTTTQLMEAKTAKIDIMEATPEQYHSELDSTEIARHFNKYRAGSFRYGFLGFNLLDSRFQDRRFRQAISHAINKEAIIKTVLRDNGSISTGPYPPHVWYASQNAPYFEYNPEKARQLLKLLGWSADRDNILRKDGVPLSFTILTNFESKERIRTAQIIQSNLKDIGIKTNINTLEWQAFRHNAISKHQFEVIVLSRAYLWDPDIYELWHSSKTKEGEWNFLSYRNKEVDYLLEKGRKTLDFEKRKRIYHKLHETLAHEQACIFLYNADLLFIAHKRIKGIKPSPLGIFHNVDKWDIGTW